MHGEGIMHGGSLEAPVVDNELALQRELVLMVGKKSSA